MTIVVKYTCYGLERSHRRTLRLTNRRLVRRKQNPVFGPVSGLAAICVGIAAGWLLFGHPALVTKLTLLGVATARARYSHPFAAADFVPGVQVAAA